MTVCYDSQTCGPQIPDRIEIWKCWREENRNTRRKTFRSKDENQQQTQPTYVTESGNETRATLVRSECRLSLLRHPCSPQKSSRLKLLDSARE